MSFQVSRVPPQRNNGFDSIIRTTHCLSKPSNWSPAARIRVRAGFGCRAENATGHQSRQVIPALRQSIQWSSWVQVGLRWGWLSYSVATNEVRCAGDARTKYNTWHKVAVYGGLQNFAVTIEKGDLVAVSDPIYTRSFASKIGKVETYAVRAKTVDMLKRKNASTSDAQDEAAVSSEPGFEPDAPDAFPPTLSSIPPL